MCLGNNNSSAFLQQSESAWKWCKQINKTSIALRLNSTYEPTNARLPEEEEFAPSAPLFLLLSLTRWHFSPPFVKGKQEKCDCPPP